MNMNNIHETTSFTDKKPNFYLEPENWIMTPTEKKIDVCVNISFVIACILFILFILCFPLQNTMEPETRIIYENPNSYLKVRFNEYQYKRNKYNGDISNKDDNDISNKDNNYILNKDDIYSKNLSIYDNMQDLVDYIETLPLQLNGSMEIIIVSTGEYGLTCELDTDIFKTHEDLAKEERDHIHIIVSKTSTFGFIYEYLELFFSKSKSFFQNISYGLHMLWK